MSMIKYLSMPHVLVQANQLLLIAIDEANLYSEWSDFVLLSVT